MTRATKNSTDKSSPTKSSQTQSKKGRRESTPEESMFKIIESIKQPHDKIIQVDSHFTRKVPLTENGISRIYTNDKKSLEEKQNFVYILGNYKFAGPSSSVDRILETMGISKNDVKSIEVNYTNYQSHRDSNKESTLTEQNLLSISDIRDLVGKSKKSKKSPVTSPTVTSGKRVSSKSKTSRTVSETLERSIQSASDLVKTLKSKNKGLDITKLSISGNTITGVRQYEIKELQPRLRKIPVPYAEGFLIVENKQSLSEFLSAIGHKESEVNTFLSEFDSIQSKLSSTQKSNLTTSSTKESNTSSQSTLNTSSQSTLNTSSQSTLNTSSQSTSKASPLKKKISLLNVRTEKLSPRSSPPRRTAKTSS